MLDQNWHNTGHRMIIVNTAHGHKQLVNGSKSLALPAMGSGARATSTSNDLFFQLALELHRV